MTKMPDDVKLNSNMMSRYLRPDRFDVEPGTTAADLKWSHWQSTFTNFIAEECIGANDTIKLKLLINHLAPCVYSLIISCSTYNESMQCLNQIYIKPKNVIYARHILATRKQQPGESVSDYIRFLKQLSLDCNFQDVSAEVYKQEFIRDAFISGICSHKIRQRLLENKSLNLDETINQALTLESAEKNALAYENSSPTTSSLNAVTPKENNINMKPQTTLQESESSYAAASSQHGKWCCFFCGSNAHHKRIKCPAFNTNCQLCSKKGHFANVCRSGKPVINCISQEIDSSDLACISAASPTSLRKATVSVLINDMRADALIDTGSSVSFIDEKLVHIMKLKKKVIKQTISLASLSHVSFVNGQCHATIKLDKHIYKEHPLLVVNNLCADIIIGHDLLRNHHSVEMEFGGDREPLHICNVLQACIPPASIFTNLSPDIKPISTKSKSFSEADEKFIKDEITKLLDDGVIEPSISPWRAQVLVTSGTTHRKRLVVDYSRTINRYTELDAYPLPKIDTIISKVSKYNYFSQIDLKSAYHQVPILSKEKSMTAFEACGNLYQFTRIPFGVTNGVAAFQRALQYIIETEKLDGTYAYLDDVTVCGKTKQEHDQNLKKFMNAVEKYQLTLNEQKCIFANEKISLLGYTIQNNSIKPDEDRLKPLMELPIPECAPSLKRALGMFAHYSRWVPNFSEKIQPLIQSTLPLNHNSVECFNKLKSEIANSALYAINHDDPLSVETDASEHSIAATLSQNGRPIAFFSRSLNESEKKHSAIEKEACAIVESLRKWRHYLIGRHFLLITDQQSVSFMLNQKHLSKIKNEKIERWRVELSCYKYDIVYRPGKENIAADALSRVSACLNPNKLYDLHKLLCHPGIVRMMHWIRTKNLPYSLDNVKSMTANCKVCAEIKPRFSKVGGKLIKAIEPFQRLNIDFKGPLPSNSSNKYILTIIDEYSRFPFAYACKDLSADSVIKSLKDLFLMFGAPSYIHSDRGTAFMSNQLKEFLNTYGVATSRTTPYNPQGNGQIERLNGTLWRTIQLCLRSKEMNIMDWEQVLPIALHSIRSLLCTATNETPHERMFYHCRRSPTGSSTPSWLLTPGPVLLKRNVRTSKYDPLVDEVELLQGNPDYSYVCMPDGRETTVSNRQLAPCPDSRTELDSNPEPECEVESNEPELQTRRSSRERTIPHHLRDYVLK